MIYLDNASTTRIDDVVLRKMYPYLTEEYGNPGSLHYYGKKAKEAVNHAREQVASFLGASSDQIIFTSGGSEANNLAIKGLKNHLLDFGPTHIVVSATEHHSTLEAIKDLLQYGFTYTVVYPDKAGIIRAKDVIAAMKDDTGFVSVMYVNNETGAINEVQKIGRYCQENGMFFMVDCVQAAGNMRIDVDELQCDFATVSSHKIHGPKGVGALYSRDRGTYLSPLVNGGKEQEFGLRGGTENVAGIVGFGEACERAGKNLLHDKYKLSNLKLLFYGELLERLKRYKISDCIHVNGNLCGSSPKVLSLMFDGVDAETLLMILDELGVYVSAGSACNSMEQVPSYVLKAMGLSDEQAQSTIRVSFSVMNSVEEVMDAAKIISSAVNKLKSGDMQIV